MTVNTNSVYEFTVDHDLRVSVDCSVMQVTDMKGVIDNLDQIMRCVAACNPYWSVMVGECEAILKLKDENQSDAIAGSAPFLVQRYQHLRTLDRIIKISPRVLRRWFVFTSSSPLNKLLDASCALSSDDLDYLARHQITYRKHLTLAHDYMWPDTARLNALKLDHIEILRK